MIFRRFRCTLGALLTLFVLSSCSLFGSDDADSSSSRYATASTARITLEYPKNWQRVPDKQTDKKIDMMLRGNRDGKAVAQVAMADVILRGVPRIKFASQILLNNQRLSTLSLKRKDAHPVQIDGAAKARRVDYVYSGTNKQHKKTDDRIRAADIAIMGPRNQVSMVRITGLKASLNDKTVNHMVKSVRFKAPSP